MKPLLDKFSMIAMQDAACARRIKALGAPSSLVQVTGNMKFDLPLTVPTADDIVENIQLKQLLDNSFVWVAGSIRSGEAEMMLQCHRQLIVRGIPSFLILAPRHPQRFNSVAEMLKKEGVPFVMRSSLPDPDACSSDCQVLLVDTVGELTKFYALAQTIFVGGSLVPMGGHNLLEPAQLGKPVLFGPYTSNFKEISRLLLECGGGMRVKNADDLISHLVNLFNDASLRQTMGQAGQSLIRENAGATDRTLSSLCKVLEL